MKNSEMLLGTPSAILKTKLNSPLIQTRLVPRPGLIKLLNEGLGRKLVLVTAPAGYGKTTVLGEWVQQKTFSAAWLSLDDSDNDLARFMTYVIAALQTVHEDLGSGTLAALRASPTPQPETILTQLINELITISTPTVLVLDDYQVIQLQPIHDAVGFLVEHLPPHIQVAIGSRIDPPLPIARWRGHGELAELREADLQFTLEEAGEFLSQAMSIELTEADLAVLAARTEGWIAGLQLAAVSLQGRPDRSAFIAAFSGSNEYIVDYLADEVLRRLPEAKRTFLLFTSILKRLTAGLCDAVTGQDTGRATLEQLRETHLFLVPLDADRRWFRYHALFADMLRKRLFEEQPDAVASLHRRAAQWFDRHGEPEQAIHHAVQARDYDLALAIIDRIAETVLERTEFTTFLKWMEVLPEEVARSRPRLRVFYAAALLFSGAGLDTVETILLEACEADESAELEGAASVVHGLIELLKGDVENSIGRSHHALDVLPEASRYFRGLVSGNLSVAYVASGDVEAARALFTEMVKEGEREGSYLSVVMTLRRLAEVSLTSGNLHQAWEVCERGLALSVDGQGRPLPVAGFLMAVQGDILRERNDLEAAKHLLQGGLALVLRWSELAALENYLYLARVQRSSGDGEAAQAAIDMADQIAKRTEMSRIPSLLVNLFQVRLWFYLGNLAAARQWERDYHTLAAFLDAQGFDPQYHHHFLEFEGITFARLRLAQGEWEKALKILAPLDQAAQTLKRHGSRIEILILQALALWRGGQPERALDALEAALLLAGPQGYVRLFIDEGEPMRALLITLLEKAREKSSRQPVSVSVDYGGQLLIALTAETTAGKITPEPTPGGLLDPLSDREQEVLRFLVTALTSTEIAQELYISPNTARYHIKNIYSKLGVHCRADAVERARTLGLL
jgi:LuxR family maltose regulon positive regulatory protein